MPRTARRKSFPTTRSVPGIGSVHKRLHESGIRRLGTLGIVSLFSPWMTVGSGKLRGTFQRTRVNALKGTAKMRFQRPGMSDALDGTYRSLNRTYPSFPLAEGNLVVRCCLRYVDPSPGAWFKLFSVLSLALGSKARRRPSVADRWT